MDWGFEKLQKDTYNEVLKAMINQPRSLFIFGYFMEVLYEPPSQQGLG